MKHVFSMFFVHFLVVLSSVVGLSVVPEQLIPDLYLKYLEAVSSDKSRSSLRRSFKDNKEYRIHVQKLKEVNGFKRHNLYIKEVARDGSHSERFYINNPVESKMPNAFLTVEEFKEALAQRITYKSTTKRVVITRNKKLYLKHMTFQPNILRTMRMFSLNTDKYVKLIKGLEVTKSSISTSKKSTSYVTVPATQVIKNELSEHNVTFAPKTVTLSEDITPDAINGNISEVTFRTNNADVVIKSIEVTKTHDTNVNPETVALLVMDTTPNNVTDVTASEGTVTHDTNFNLEAIILSNDTTPITVNANITEDTFITNNDTKAITALEKPPTPNDEHITRKHEKNPDSNKSAVSYEENTDETSTSPSDINLEAKDNITTLKIQDNPEMKEILADYADMLKRAEAVETSMQPTKRPKPSRPLVYEFKPPDM